MRVTCVAAANVLSRRTSTTARLLASSPVLLGPAWLGGEWLLSRHARGTRGCASASQCEEPGQKWRRPKAGTSGTCSTSGVRFYAARSLKAADSSHCFAIAEQLHQFVVVDSITLERSSVRPPDSAEAKCAKLCAERLPSTVSRAFAERVRRVHLQAATRPDGSLFDSTEEAVAAFWADALMAGFQVCDQMAQESQECAGAATGALFCAVADSGVYVASVGLGRVVIGTEEAGGQVFCDEASSPHRAASDAEGVRLREGQGQSDSSTGPFRHPMGPEAPTRLLGGASLKGAEPRLISLPDVVRLQHAEQRRFVILGSPGLWDLGPRLPVQWAIEAYKAGRSPADELVARSRGEDVVALVLVLPQGLGLGDGKLPPHDELVAR